MISGLRRIWSRDGHVRLTTSVLQTLFDRIAAVDNDPKRYQAVATEWGHYLRDDGTRPDDTMASGLTEQFW